MPNSHPRHEFHLFPHTIPVVHLPGGKWVVSHCSNVLFLLARKLQDWGFNFEQLV